MTVSVLWLFLAVPWVGLQYVIVVFPYHTHPHYIQTGIIMRCAQKELHCKFVPILSLPDPMLNSDSNNMMEGTSDMDGEKTML